MIISLLLVNALFFYLTINKSIKNNIHVSNNKNNNKIYTIFYGIDYDFNKKYTKDVSQNFDIISTINSKFNALSKSFKDDFFYEDELFF